MSGYVKGGYAPGDDITGSGPNGELLASDVENDSSVPGSSVKDALNILLSSGGGSGVVSLKAELIHMIKLGFVNEDFFFDGDGNLTEVDYTDDQGGFVYKKEMTYDEEGILTAWKITRISDNEQLTCDLTYNNGELVKKEYS